MGAQLYYSAEEAREELRTRGITVEEATPAVGKTNWGAHLGELLGSWQKVMGHQEAEDDVTQRAWYELQSSQCKPYCSWR